MSLNTAHINGGVLIHSGECILLFCEHVNMEWSGNSHPAFQGTKTGRLYLTTHRMIFNHKNTSDAMQSFSFPFITLSEVDLEQPVFGANYIKGKVRAQPNGNWVGEAKFKLTFKRGGAIEFGQAMLKAAHLASRNSNQNEPPPPYVPPETQWYAAPPSAYAAPPQGFYGWMPPVDTFPDRPPQNGVFMSDAPPPYPGLAPNAPPSYSAGGGYQGYHPPQQAGWQQSAPPHQDGYPPQGAWQQAGSPQAGYPPQGGYPQHGASGGPHQSSADAKAAEAAQSAYYDPNRPQMAYVPPPAYYENPPSYNQATNKKDQ